MVSHNVETDGQEIVCICSAALCDKIYDYMIKSQKRISFDYETHIHIHIQVVFGYICVPTCLCIHRFIAYIVSCRVGKFQCLIIKNNCISNYKAQRNSLGTHSLPRFDWKCANLQD